MLYEATHNADCSEELRQTKCQLESFKRERARGIMQMCQII